MMIEKYQDFIDILKVSIPIYKNDTKKGYIKEIITRTIRMVESVSPLDVSKKAQEKADMMGIGSLYQYGWLDQKRRNGMQDYNREIFHWEHFYPIQQQVDELLALEELTDEAIYHIIRRGKICWILKEENQILDRIAKSKRPNPEEAYQQAGIILLGKKEK
jgi:hypothetical protein